MAKLFFPKGFLWGSGGSAYQIEGGNSNTDWWQWEHSAKRAADLRAKDKNQEDYFSGDACDSYNRYEEDFDIAAELNMNCQRISIEWSRIEPNMGEFSADEIEHYRKVLSAMRFRGMATFVTLHHFTLPVWFSRMGGFERRENVARFTSYASRIIEDLGALIDFIIPINEPNVYVTFGYVQAEFPPHKRSPLLSFRVTDNMVTAHRQVYEFTKEQQPRIQVGTAHSFTSDRFSWFTELFAPYLLGLNFRFQDRVADRSDFVGVNYYFSHAVKATWKPPFIYSTFEAKEVTDFGWEIYPEGMYKVLKFCAARYPGLPVYVTENGIADVGDKLRAKYIHDHLVNVHKALSDGIDVRGYLYWSLLDNFEWAEAYRMKFGLVEIDREHGLQRRVRKSARYYAQVCKGNFVDSDDLPAEEPPQ